MLGTPTHGGGGHTRTETHTYQITTGKWSEQQISLIYFNFSPATRRAFRGDSLHSCELLPSYFLARIDLRPGFRSIAATLSSLQVGEQVYRELKGLSMWSVRFLSFFFFQEPFANFPRLTHRSERYSAAASIFDLA